ncbi:CYTH domain-containing protein [Falsiphaeobacter marinintestinus]|uniref:CYTH domain-containing protein n=1 Tax=Falsiphaeobacter marinintestinus TaxID=1492905 RepID=UPI0011B826A9|nr:CYTH domain-containing protein [Phaeobacter marinintestinus]
MPADGVEIERKFLVRCLPDLGDARRAVIRQGYLTQPSDSVEIRLRQKDEACFLTLKSDGGTVRVERETEISQAQFDTLWPETEGRRVEKERWTGELPGDLKFELDLFSGALDSLRLVEVEFESESTATAFTAPDWFGADVTQDKRFKNKALALDGMPD